MSAMPVSGGPDLRRLARRLALGLFLDTWPRWAVSSLLLAGLVALVCRMFFPGAASGLAWLWLAPLVVTLPVLVVCFIRAYRPAEVAAVADWLSGGQGVVLTQLEKNDPAWVGSKLFQSASRFALPRLRPWRRLAVLPPAVAFLALALALPQRMTRTDAALADDIAADLTAALVELRQQDLITPEEEKRLEEEIERLRRSAEERVDASSWEAADAVREKVAAGLSDKQDALKWAEDSLSRFAAAANGASNLAPGSEAQAAELMNALEKLARTGLLDGAPQDLRRLADGGKLPTDAKSLQQLAASLSKYLAETDKRFGRVARLGKEFGRFDPSEFPLDSDEAAAGEGAIPGQGGIDRGRADAPLTWGQESSPFDRFKATPLPSGAPRSPDDWAPLVELPGVPQESPQVSGRSAARQYAAASGQAAWRRNLAPRHQRAVKKYFEK